MTSSGIRQALAAAEGGRRLAPFEAMALAEYDDLATLTALAEQLCLAGHGTHVSFSKKVFIPLTKLCRDVCHYCTFAHAPREGEPHYLSPEAVLDIARGGRRPAARRRCSRWATSRSCATPPPATPCGRSAPRRRSTISRGRRRWC